jgi:hypothetical protein
MLCIGTINQSIVEMTHIELNRDIQFFKEKSIRRGVVTNEEISRIVSRHGQNQSELLAEDLNSAGVRVVAEDKLIIKPQTNILMNNLRLVELVSLALQLPAAPKLRRSLYQNVLQQRSYGLDLIRLDYLDNDDDWYYLSPDFNRLQQAIRQLFNTGRIPFSKDWKKGGKKDNLAFLGGLINHQHFENEILPHIRDYYRSLRDVRLFIKWNQASGNEIPVMVDIVMAGIDKDKGDMVRSLLFSDQASTAFSVLKKRIDICFVCPPNQKCMPIKNVYDPYDLLLEYRYASLSELLTSKYPNKSFLECLVSDKLIMKFFIPYSIVVSTKKFFQDIQLIDGSATLLYKNSGKYCPCCDEWPLINLG